MKPESEQFLDIYETLNGKLTALLGFRSEEGHPVKDISILGRQINCCASVLYVNISKTNKLLEEIRDRLPRNVKPQQSTEGW